MTGSPEAGCQLPQLKTRPPGPESRSWLLRYGEHSAPMGPRRAANVAPSSIVLSKGIGSNVECVDGNRYVDLAAGFGALLLGHSHPAVVRALELQSGRLWQALGDVYPSDAKIGLTSRIAELHGHPQAKVLFGQSGADAITGALKTAVLATGKSGVLAFQGSYHGLSYGPLAVSDLRASYREPFKEQLSPHTTFVPYPADSQTAERSLDLTRAALSRGDIGALLIEPIAGRGGVLLPPPGFLAELARITRDAGALLIADEIWTGLGRSGSWIRARADGAEPDLICFGKGLGGGLPISACVGAPEIMNHWSQDAEVVHTSTFAAAPLACATALATLDTLSRKGWVERAAIVGQTLHAALTEIAGGYPGMSVRGAGLMIGLDVASLPGGAGRLQRQLLERGYITSTGGGARDVLVLTPPLTIGDAQLAGFLEVLPEALQACTPS